MSSNCLALMAFLWTLTFLTCTKKESNEIELYPDFEPGIHFTPEVNKLDFYRESGYDLAWMLASPLFDLVKGKEDSLAIFKRLSPGQRALYFWWNLDGQASLGGFEQYYFNGMVKQNSGLEQGLELIGDTTVLNIVRQSKEVYNKNRRLFIEANNIANHLFGSLDDFQSLNQQFLDRKSETLSLLEKYIRSHSSSFCMDSDGNPIDGSFSGIISQSYADGSPMDSVQIFNGQLNGIWKQYYSSGKRKAKLNYAGGIQSGEQEYYFENGMLEAREKQIDSLVKKEVWHPNGKKASETFYTAAKKAMGKAREWFENGSIKSESNFEHGELSGAFKSYYKSGKIRTEATFSAGVPRYINHWTPNGKQILKNGTGLLISEYESLTSVFFKETTFREYKKYGPERTFINGNLAHYANFRNDTLHGRQRDFYLNGKTQKEEIYKNGQLVSTQVFPRFVKPVCHVNFSFEYIPPNSLLKDPKPLKIKPVCTNTEDVLAEAKCPEKLFESQNQELTGTLSAILQLNPDGKVNSFDIQNATLCKGSELDSILKILTFEKPLEMEPGVLYQIKLDAEFSLEEGDNGG